MPVWEAVQIALGLAIRCCSSRTSSPMRGHYILDGADTLYSETLPDLWGKLALGQTALLLVVWMHACIGLHFWLRLARFYRRASPFLLAAAVLIPALSLAGFVVAGRDAVEREPQRRAASGVRIRLCRTTGGAATAADARRTSSSPSSRCFLTWLGLSPCSRRALVLFALRAAAAASARRHPRQLHGGTDAPRGARADAARDQPRFRRAACLDLRRPGALLDLPRQGRERATASCRRPAPPRRRR